MRFQEMGNPSKIGGTARGLEAMEGNAIADSGELPRMRLESAGRLIAG
jgi:hypothetical protein